MRQPVFEFDDVQDKRLAVLPNGQVVPVGAIDFLWRLEARTGSFGSFALDKATREERDRFIAMEVSCSTVMLFEAASYYGARRA